MGHIKLTDTQYLPCQPHQYSLKGVHPDWETHPSFITGIEALNAYHFWVAEVVLPIAFQWIYENKPKVYKSVPKEHYGDVGVVFAAAFEVIKDLPEYKNGLVAFEKYKKALADGSWDSSQINPVWSGVTKKVRKATKKSFDAESASLKDSIR